MSGVILVPPCAFMACTGTHLPLRYPLQRFHTVSSILGLEDNSVSVSRKKAGLGLSSSD
jgi:hypothetical protein